MQFNVGDGVGISEDGTEEELNWRRRAAEAFQDIHANFTQETSVISQVNKIVMLMQQEMQKRNLFPPLR